jgi:hypothetical protein
MFLISDGKYLFKNGKEHLLLRIFSKSADQWLNRKEWCLGSGRRRQLSQDRKDR